MNRFPGMGQTTGTNTEPLQRSASTSTSAIISGKRSISSRLFQTKTPSEVLRIEERVDIDSQIKNLENNNLKLLKADTLYKTGFLHSKSDLVTTLSRHKISCVGEDNLVDLPLILRDDYSQLSARRLMHLGLITIGVIGLTRQGT
ncbi:hypothetical protein Dsin_032012 [Dipteronia sinensis]|uniref:Uncharacterized protein n=1 Tax=Dipteronia sinensis TaxID=43782 RepID=A0AAE0DSN3_9ROSI|nr:hypothetical protein Dsin_032012 [Dipteronia sinensis]